MRIDSRQAALYNLGCDSCLVRANDTAVHYAGASFEGAQGEAVTLKAKQKIIIRSAKRPTLVATSLQDVFHAIVM